MSWKNGLRPAMLGGVQFHTSDRGLKGGRAGVTHEFPKRNSPKDEDMGRKTRHWSVDAYLIGDDYMEQRDALVRVCERPGPVYYQDHWGRSGTVRVDDYDIKESSQDGRMARVSLALVEAGSAAASAPAAATNAVLAGASQALGLVGLASFATTGIVGQAPAAIGLAMRRYGLPASLATSLAAGLRAGSSGAVASALASGAGITLARGMPSRVAGAVLDEATVAAVVDELPR